ncbi:MAG: deoxyribonuclease IV [Actinomycetota bacterium]|nr:deoxyribonuclease IV [Actinomycetota bacterium]
MLIGAHVSPAGGLARAIERGTERGCESIQIFNQSPRMWRPTAYGEEDFAAFRAAMDASPVRAVLIHAVYLLNCASEDPEIREKSLRSLIHSLRIGDAIDGCGVVLHPGSAKTGDVGEAIARAGAVIGEALAESERCPLHLENTAGAGGTLGRSFDELAALLDAVGGGEGGGSGNGGKSGSGQSGGGGGQSGSGGQSGGSGDQSGDTPRLGLCLDSCHLLASGYDIRTAQGLSETLDELDRVAGLDRLRSLHLNDSARPLGCNRDRHANLGDGELGDRGCAVFLSEPRFEGLPCVLETPGPKGAGPAAEEVALARELRKRGRAKRARDSADTRLGEHRNEKSR